MLTFSSNFIGVLFAIHFSGYYWDPCSGGNTCLAVEGSDVAPETVICADVECVETTLNKNGIEHLDQIIRIDYTRESATVTPVDVQHKITISD